MFLSILIGKIWKEEFQKYFSSVQLRGKEIKYELQTSKTYRFKKKVLLIPTQI